MIVFTAKLKLTAKHTTILSTDKIIKYTLYYTQYFGTQAHKVKSKNDKYIRKIMNSGKKTCPSHTCKHLCNITTSITNIN